MSLPLSLPESLNSQLVYRGIDFLTVYEPIWCKMAKHPYATSSLIHPEVLVANIVMFFVTVHCCCYCLHGRSIAGPQEKKSLICWQRKENRSIDWRQKLQVSCGFELI